SEVEVLRICVDIVRRQRGRTQSRSTGACGEGIIHRQAWNLRSKVISIQHEGRVPNDFKIVPHIIVVEDPSRTSNHRRIVAEWPVSEAKSRRKIIPIVIHQPVADTLPRYEHTVTTGRPR